jgi:oligosaccharyltransferase complex subunit alpha (ribophorin I)
MLSALWRSLSLLLVALPLIYAQAFENTAIVRTVDLGGASVHVTTTYAVKALEPASKYVLALPGDVADKTSFLEVKVKGTREPLYYEFKGIDPTRYVLPNIWRQYSGIALTIIHG